MEYLPPKFMICLAFMYGHISAKEMEELIELREKKERICEKDL